jgi:UrcA family protein
MKLWNLIRSHYSFALLTLIPILTCHAEGSTPTVTVPVADLNLQSTPGKETLLRRIEAAANTVCSSPEGKDLVRVIHHQRCRRLAIADAIAKLHSPEFAAYTAEHFNHSPSPALSTTAGAQEAARPGTPQE